MAKSSNIERAMRVNMAVDLLKNTGSFVESAKSLASHYGISKRQAYRYVKMGESIGKQIPIPEKKIAFTVKLSENLTQELRQYAQLQGQTLSEVVTEALEVLLYKGRRSG